MHKPSYTQKVVHVYISQHGLADGHMDGETDGCTHTHARTHHLNHLMTAGDMACQHHMGVA